MDERNGWLSRMTLRIQNSGTAYLFRCGIEYGVPRFPSPDSRTISKGATVIAGPWYRQYADLSRHVRELRDHFIERCKILGVHPNRVLSEVWKEIVVRAVQESNWQEGIYVEPGRTQELALHVFGDLTGVAGPHLDFERILEDHKRRVVALKRKKLSIEEIGAYNLSAAHLAITWIGEELARRQTASLAYAVRQFQDLFAKGRVKLPQEAKELGAIQRGFDIVDDLLDSTQEVRAPITGGVQDEGLLLRHLLHMEFDDLLNPMRVEYIHFLHRLIMMGIADPRRCGVSRKIPVHVGNPDLLLPPPSAIEGLMQEFCSRFPAILPTTVKYDPIMKAAEVSHRFVRIHPYHDGNGRISRLLMNLVLWGHHPPVYLKADKKGRHRYAQAIRRGDHGRIEPLACLIAMGLIEVYQKVLRSVERQE
jgi:fido (protein-threonine AMPylation protein)